MNHLVAINSDATMDSLDFLREIINPSRIGCGEPEVKNAHFVSRVEDELDDLPAVKIIHRFGNEVRSYDLTIDQMMLVGMRESKAVRKNVLAKLKEIKSPSLPDFNDPVAAARAWADAKEQALIAEEKLAIAAPKVDFFDNYVDQSGTFSFRNAAKILKVKENVFKDFLINSKSVYISGKTMIPYSCHIDCGRFEVKTGSSDSGHAFKQMLFTAKGVAWIDGLMSEAGVTRKG